MALHSEEQKRQSREAGPVAWDLNGRDLERNEDWCRDLVEHSQDLLCIHDLEGRFLSVDPLPARLLGYSVEEMLQKPMRDFLAPQFQEKFDEYLREIERTGEAHGLLRVVTRSGEHRIWEYHNTLRTDGVPAPIVRGIAHDVTEGMRAEKALRASCEQMEETARQQEKLLHDLTLFRTLLDQSNDSIKVIDLESLRFLDVNERSYEELGYSREELLSMTVYDIDPNADRNLLDRVRRQFQETGFAIMETVHRRKDGTTFPVEVNLRQVRLDREYVVSVSRDITVRKRVEKALRESEARERARARELETVLDAVPVAVCIAHDAECRRMTGNRAACEQMGLPAGSNFSKSAPPEERPGFRVMQDGLEIPADLLPMQEAAIKGKAVYCRPLTVVREDGSVLETLATAVPLLDEAGKPRGSVGASIDLTEMKRAETALRESELRFRTVYERSPVGIALIDSTTGKFLRVNPKFCEIAGRSQEELLQSGILAITHADDIGPSEQSLRQLTEGKLGSREIEKKYVRPDGSVRWVSVLGVSMSSKGEKERWQMGLVQDITERKQSEQAVASLLQELSEAKGKLVEEKLYLEQEIDTELGFGEIIGHSKALQAVMEKVGKVAASNATVLLLGETGTGKELVARAIHRLSLRADKGFIKLNCAAIPSGLLESELFGHERGAFTGAVSKKVGRLELADKGTLFLDEIGEISLMLQPKLLRVLQDQEFERLGGIETLKVDFRLIAATNRNLADSVRESEFRSDLYYRLNVFPIRVPPLRERREDIQLLVEHFVHKFAQRMKKSITSIPTSAVQALEKWEWPGNVRELENFIERSVILTQGSVLVSPLSELQSMAGEKRANDERLEAAEREHILRALRDSHGQIGGLRGAAMRLGLKRTTLQSKLKHLGIEPRGPRTRH
jgi:formate hydrogenlyase transcriptional activator